MPRARRRCAKPGCRNFQPCIIKEHQRGWAASKSEPLPPNWKQLCRLVVRRSEGRCEVRRQIGPVMKRCHRPGVQVDHIINRARWPKGQPGVNGFHPDINNPNNNLQHICETCHTLKTNMEKKEGRRKSGNGAV